MIEFPSLTVVEKRLPKEAFYTNLSLTKSIKEKFVSDIDKIWVQNSLTDKILHLDSSAEIKEILVLRLDMKKQDCEPKILETIARQNTHQLIFLLQYEATGMLAVYYHKLYQSPWYPLVNLHLEIMGFTLDEIWTHFLEQIALQHESRNSETDALPIDERLQRQETIQKLETQICALEKAARNEQQPKKRFTLYTKLQQVKKILEDITNG